MISLYAVILLTKSTVFCKKFKSWESARAGKSRNLTVQLSRGWLICFVNGLLK